MFLILQSAKIDIMGNKIQTKAHRLPAVWYHGFVTTAFTCCIEDKNQIITKEEIISVCKDILFAESIILSG